MYTLDDQSMNQSWSNLLETCLVGGLPDLGQCYGTMEPMEYTERQSEPLDDGPWHKPIEIQLHLNQQDQRLVIQLTPRLMFKTLQQQQNEIKSINKIKVKLNPKQ